MLNPGVENVNTIGKVANCKTIKNLTQDIEELNKYVADYLMACMKELFGDYYIGDTLQVNFENAPAHTLGIDVKTAELKNGLYIAIVSKDMDFIFCPNVQADFHHGQDSIGERFVPKKKDSYVSFACDKGDVVVEDAIFDRLNQKGNLVFIHPENYLAEE